MQVGGRDCTGVHRRCSPALHCGTCVYSTMLHSTVPYCHWLPCWHSVSSVSGWMAADCYSCTWTLVHCSEAGNCSSTCILNSALICCCVCNFCWHACPCCLVQLQSPTVMARWSSGPGQPAGSCSSQPAGYSTQQQQQQQQQQTQLLRHSQKQRQPQ
jgi:hypothetical protein